VRSLTWSRIAAISLVATVLPFVRTPGLCQGITLQSNDTVGSEPGSRNLCAALPERGTVVRTGRCLWVFNECHAIAGSGAGLATIRVPVIGIIRVCGDFTAVSRPFLGSGAMSLRRVNSRLCTSALGLGSEMEAKIVWRLMDRLSDAPVLKLGGGATVGVR